MHDTSHQWLGSRCVLLSGYPVAAVDRHACASTHHNAINESHVGFAQGAQEVV